jgi:hypothetical protein
MRLCNQKSNVTGCDPTLAKTGRKSINVWTGVLGDGYRVPGYFGSEFHFVELN